MRHATKKVCSRMEDTKYAEEPLLLLQYLIAYAIFLVDRKSASKYWLYENDDPVRRKTSLTQLLPVFQSYLLCR